MKRWCLSGLLALVVLAGAGCRRQVGDWRSRGYDANLDLAAGAAPVEPAPDLLADQMVLSRRAREARAVPAPAPAPAPTPGATTTPAAGTTGADTPKDVMPAGPGPEANTAAPSPGPEANTAMPPTAPPPTGVPTAPPGPGTLQPSAPPPARPSAPPPDTAAGTPADPQVVQVISETLMPAVQQGLRAMSNASFGDFLVEEDANAAKAIAEAAKKFGEKMRALGPLGLEKLQVSLMEFVGGAFAGAPTPWIPALRWAFVPTDRLQFRTSGQKVTVTVPESPTGPVTLVQAGGKWKMEYTPSQREALKLVADFHDAQVKFLDAIVAGITSGEITKENYQTKIGEQRTEIVMPAWDKANENPEIGPPPRGR